MEGLASCLEGAGAETVTFSFRGTEVTIPLAIERWPTDDIKAEKPARAVRTLLGEQRPPMRTRGDVIELSHRMADACGLTPLPEDKAKPDAWFGAVPTLLDVLDNHGDDLEADLLRFFGVDARKSYLHGGPTYRQIWVYVRRLPPESALMCARNRGDLQWTRTDLILARLWELLTQKHYAGRPYSREEIEEWVAEQAKNAALMAKDREREAYYASGQNMRDAGVDPGPRAPRQPPQPREAKPNDPVLAALAVAKRNASRQPPRGAPNDRTSAQQPGRPYNPAGSGWG